MPEDVQIAQVVKAGTAAAVGAVHTSCPGEVILYDPATQTVTVQPTVKRPLFDDDGEVSYEIPPVLLNVPVSFPRGAGFFMAWHLQPGDTGILVFAEHNTGEWRSSGRVSEPTDTRRHGLSGATFIPGVAPMTKPLAEAVLASPGGIILGQEGNPQSYIQVGPTGVSLGLGTDAVALASLVTTVLTAIVGAYNLHTHTAGGAGVPATPFPLPLSPVGATHVKGS